MDGFVSGPPLSMPQDDEVLFGAKLLRAGSTLLFARMCTGVTGQRHLVVVTNRPGPWQLRRATGNRPAVGRYHSPAVTWGLNMLIYKYARQIAPTKGPPQVCPSCASPLL